MADTTIPVTETSPVTDNPVQPLADPAVSDTLALGASEMTAPAPVPTGLESGMVVLATPFGKASVDRNAPATVTDAFTKAAAPSGIAPVFSEDGKRIVGGVQGSSARGKGKLVVRNSMITTASGTSYVQGQLVDPKDLTDDERDLFTSGDNPALLPFGT